MSKSGATRVIHACISALIVSAEAIAAANPFVFALRGKPVDSLSPLDAFSTNTMTIEAQILEGLMRFDPRKPDQEPQRNLAAEHYIIDPVTYVFRLRKDIYFHPFKDHPKDRVTPDDVRFSLELAKASTSPLALESVREIRAIETVGNDLVKIKLNRPNHNFLAWLATSIGHITSRAYFESLDSDEWKRMEKFKRHPIGTGPYLLPGPIMPNMRTIVLERFVNYRDIYWTRSSDSVPRVAFRFYDDPKAILKGIQDDEIAMTTLPLTEYGDGVNVSPRKGTLTLLTPPFLVILEINMAKPPLNDVRMRQLLNAAVYRPKVLQICRSDPDDLPAGFQYYLQIPQTLVDPQPAESIARMLADPSTREGFRRLRESGITILAPNRPDHMIDQILSVVASDLRTNLGLEVRVLKQNFSSLQDIDRYKPDLIYVEWTPDTPWQHTNAAILKPLFDSRSLYNFGRYSDPEVDRLFQQIHIVSDPSTTEKNYAAIRERLAKTAPVIWLPSVRHTTLFLRNGYDAPYMVRPGGGRSSNLLHYTSMVKDIRRAH